MGGDTSMAAGQHPYLTTKEVADLLRLKERKVYDLVAEGGIPCVRATGKLLFPRDLVEASVLTFAEQAEAVDDHRLLHRA